MAAIDIPRMVAEDISTCRMTEMLTAEWNLVHPNTCNCERCDWMLSLALKAAFKAYYSRLVYKVVDMMEPQPEKEGGA